MTKLLEASECDVKCALEANTALELRVASLTFKYQQLVRDRAPPEQREKSFAVLCANDVFCGTLDEDPEKPRSQQDYLYHHHPEPDYAPREPFDDKQPWKFYEDHVRTDSREEY